MKTCCLELCRIFSSWCKKCSAFSTSKYSWVNYWHHSNVYHGQINPTPLNTNQLFKFNEKMNELSFARNQNKIVIVAVVIIRVIRIVSVISLGRVGEEIHCLSASLSIFICPQIKQRDKKEVIINHKSLPKFLHNLREYTTPSQWKCVHYSHIINNCNNRDPQ